MYTIEELHRDIEQFFKPASVRIPCRFCNAQGSLTYTTEHCGHEVETTRDCPVCTGSGSTEAPL